MDLPAFGLILSRLRDEAGLNQETLARELSVSLELISKWERAYNHKGRQWKPDRATMLKLVKFFAEQLTPEEAQYWVRCRDFRLTGEELQALFPDTFESNPFELSLPIDAAKANLARQPLITGQQLVGVEAAHNHLVNQLEEVGPPYIISIEGIGGIGKTSLASLVTETIMKGDRFYDLAWVSAKQEEFRLELGLAPVPKSGPALTEAGLIDALLLQLAPNLVLTAGDRKETMLMALLRKHPYLVVIDNLETVEDYESLLPLLQRLRQPSKFLLTSRHSLKDHSGIYCQAVPDLSEADSVRFLKQEAAVRNLLALTQAKPAQLRRIYKVVGGNPLALKLVVGQVSTFSLSQVLEDLKQAQGKKVEDLYSYIYWHAWNKLDPAAQRVFLVMPLANGGPLDHLVGVISDIEQGTVQAALDQLVKLSLVQVEGDLDDRRYTIHRLTETFLLNEVIKWKQE